MGVWRRLRTRPYLLPAVRSADARVLADLKRQLHTDLTTYSTTAAAGAIRGGRDTDPLREDRRP